MAVTRTSKYSTVTDLIDAKSHCVNKLKYPTENINELRIDCIISLETSNGC